MTNILLHGGGLDSTALFLRMVKEGINFICVHVDYGHAAARLERKHIEYQCKKYGIEFVQLRDTIIRALNPNPNKLFGDLVDNYYIESRNITFIALALRNFPLASTIYLGLDKPVSGKALPDCSVDFIKSVSSTFDILIEAPLIDIDKENFCKEAHAYDDEFFDLSMTCWHPIEESECGTCKHCVTKQQITNSLGV